jgi:hypothetical protein
MGLAFTMLLALASSHSWVRIPRTHDHILLSQIQNPQPGGPDLHIYIPQEQGGLVIPPGTGFPFYRLLQLRQ